VRRKAAGNTKTRKKTKKKTRKKTRKKTKTRLPILQVQRLAQHRGKLPKRITNLPLLKRHSLSAVPK